MFVSYSYGYIDETFCGVFWLLQYNSKKEKYAVQLFWFSEYYSIVGRKRFQKLMQMEERTWKKDKSLFLKLKMQLWELKCTGHFNSMFDTSSNFQSFFDT